MSASTNNLRLAVEKALRASAQPMSSNQLFAIASVNTHTKSVHSVTNCLATLWREGQLTRVRAHNKLTQDCIVRWAYCWKYQAIARSLSNVSDTAGENSSWYRYIATLKSNT